LLLSETPEMIEARMETALFGVYKLPERIIEENVIMLEDPADLTDEEQWPLIAKDIDQKALEFGNRIGFIGIDSAQFAMGDKNISDPEHCRLLKPAFAFFRDYEYKANKGWDGKVDIVVTNHTTKTGMDLGAQALKAACDNFYGITASQGSFKLNIIGKSRSGSIDPNSPPEWQVLPVRPLYGGDDPDVKDHVAIVNVGTPGAVGFIYAGRDFTPNSGGKGKKDDEPDIQSGVQLNEKEMKITRALFEADFRLDIQKIEALTGIPYSTVNRLLGGKQGVKSRLLDNDLVDFGREGKTKLFGLTERGRKILTDSLRTINLNEVDVS
jgi:hypothetical protein